MVRFLFSPFGRIGRAGWWLGQLIYASMVLTIILLVSYAFMQWPGNADPSIQKPSIIVMIILGVLGTWIYGATCIKRFHDRGKSAWWFFLISAPNIVTIGFSMAGGAKFVLDFIQSTDLIFVLQIISVLQIVSSIFAIWILVECGFLSGDEGDNQFGPGPGFDLDDEIAQLSERAAAKIPATTSPIKMPNPTPHTGQASKPLFGAR